MASNDPLPCNASMPCNKQPEDQEPDRNSNSMAIKLNNIGFILHGSHDPKTATELFKNALDALDHLVPHASVSDEHELMRKMNRHQNKLRESVLAPTKEKNKLPPLSDDFEGFVDMIMRPILLRTDSSYERDVVKMIIQHNIGVSAFLERKLDDAVRYLEKANEIDATVLSSRIELLPVQCALGIVYMRLNRVEDGLQVLTTVLGLQFQYKSNKNRVHALALNQWGNLYVSMDLLCLSYTCFFGESLVGCEHQPNYHGDSAIVGDTNVSASAA